MEKDSITKLCLNNIEEYRKDGCFFLAVKCGHKFFIYYKLSDSVSQRAQLSDVISLVTSRNLLPLVPTLRLFAD